MIYTHGATPLTVSLGYPRRFGAVVIGEDCWLAMGCIVYPRSRLEKSEQRWCLELGRGRRIVLLLSEDEALGEASVERTSVFCLEPRPESGRVPHFVFAELTIHGEKTAFAAGIADRIARNYGYSLVFAEPS